MSDAEIIFRETAAIDAAVDLLFRYDPDRHHPRDYVLTIAGTILGRPLALHDARTWKDAGEQIVGIRG